MDAPKPSVQDELDVLTKRIVAATDSATLRIAIADLHEYLDRHQTKSDDRKAKVENAAVK